MSMAALSELLERRLKAECERPVKVGQSTCDVLAVTGEPYVIIGTAADGALRTGGVLQEGQARQLYADETEAFDAALAAFHDYAAGKSGTLYWREDPRLEWDDGRSGCAFYLRCVISEKTVSPLDANQNL